MYKYCNKDNQEELLSKLTECVSDATMGKVGSDYEDDIILRELFKKTLIEAGIFNNRSLVDLNECISYTLWTKDDIRGELIELGYEANEENINTVIESGLLKHLGDCLDDQWSEIHYAIKETLGELERDI